MNNLPPINQLRAFSAAVRYGSVTAAAKALHLTQAAVSRQITQLEQRLTVSLFLRSAEGLELTELGRNYYSQVDQALTVLEDAEEALKPVGAKVRHRIVMSVDGAFIATWLAPRLGHFLKQYPEINIEVSVGKSLGDDSGKHPVAADLLIVYGRPPWPRYKAKKLLEFVEFPVCSPELAKRIKHHSDLSNISLINEADHTGWSRWLKSVKLGCDVNINDGPIIYHSVSCLTMALHGAGLAIGDNLTCADWLREGRLVKPFSEVVETEDSFYLLTGEAAEERVAVDKFKQWLLTELATIDD